MPKATPAPPEIFHLVALAEPMIQPQSAAFSDEKEAKMAPRKGSKKMREGKVSRQSPPEPLADRMDRLSDTLRHRKRPSNVAYRIFLKGVLDMSITILDWVLSATEIAVDACSELAVSLNEGLPETQACKPSSDVASEAEEIIHDPDSLTGGMLRQSCPHLHGRFKCHEERVRILIDTGSEATFILKSVIPTDQKTFTIAPFGISGSCDGTKTMVSEVVKVELEIDGCVPTNGYYQYSDRPGYMWCPPGSSATDNNIAASLVPRTEGGLVTAKMEVWAYVAPLHNGGVDVLLGTNVLASLRSFMSMAQDGMLTIDQDFGAGITRVGAPIVMEDFENY